MATPRDLKVQMAGETRARERAQALAATQGMKAQRAETAARQAEAALRQAEAALREAEVERDAWKARALTAEADVARLTGDAPT